jgi:hypothetical protein
METHHKIYSAGHFPPPFAWKIIDFVNEIKEKSILLAGPLVFPQRLKMSFYIVLDSAKFPFFAGRF